MIKTGELFGVSLQEALRTAAKGLTFQVPEITVRHIDDFYYIVRCGERHLDYATSQKQLDYLIAGMGSYDAVLRWHVTNVLGKFFPPVHKSVRFPKG
jgi:hypothetical protein